MKARVFIYWESLRTSFWFQPSLMAAAAVGLSFAAVAIDARLTQRWLESVTWIYSGGPDGARAVLQTIAGSMITIAGVVFSLTLVALSIASSQFGSRMLRNFMRDATNQTVLGTFIATFLYCLLVLRTIRSEAQGFVPHLSVTLGVVLALASLWMLIYFIHHVAVSIQADEVVTRVGADLDEAIDRLFPEVDQQGVGMPEIVVLPDDAESKHIGARAGFGHGGWLIPAPDDGYLQRVDLESLVLLAQKNKIVVRLDRRPGHYLVSGTTVGAVWPEQTPDPMLVKQIQATFVIGNQRTANQDVEFGILQLVEIAVRALSAGINDPFTAIACVDRLGSTLVRLARRPMPSCYRVDIEATVRVITSPLTFSGMIDTAFNQLRQYARTNAEVTIRLLETIAVVASMTSLPANRDALRRQAAMINAGAQSALPEAYDRHSVKLRHDTVAQALEAHGDLFDQPEVFNEKGIQ